MTQWFVQVGIYSLAIVLVFLGALVLVAWGLFGNRSKGRARCPRCWYDMRGRRPGREGLVCPECGHDARRERRLFKNHRRWRAIVPGVVLAFLAGYPLTVVAGWYWERPTLERLRQRDPRTPMQLLISSVRPDIDIRVEPFGPPWLIQRLPPQLAQYFDRCVNLHLGKDGFKSGDTARLSRLRYLRWVSFRDAPLRDAGLADIGELTQTGSLDLAGTKITDAGLAHLEDMSRLRELDLEETQITDAGLVHVGRLTNMEELVLRATDITGSGLVHLQGLTKLTRLDLDRTNVKDSAVAHVGLLPNLETLKLNGTDVSDAGLGHLAGLKKLTRLEMHSTDVTDGGVAKLTRALPGLTEFH